MEAEGARLLDRGYRRYQGVRLGPRAAVRSLAVHSLRHVLGLRRPPWSKVLPAVTILISYVPALVFLGLVALLPGVPEEILPSYPEYYFFIGAAIILFTAFVIPELLCPDRRSRVLALYLSASLNRDTYLVSKGAAAALVLGFVTLGPLLVLLVGFWLLDVGPAGIGEALLVLVRIIAAGLALALVYGSVGLAVAGFTDRRAFASAGILLLMIGSGIAASSLVAFADAPRWVLLFSLNEAPFELVQRIYGESGGRPGLSTGLLVAGAAAWVGGAVAVLRTQYARLDVTR